MPTSCEEFKTKRIETEALYEKFVSVLKEVEESDSPEARDRAEILLGALESKLMKLREEFIGYLSLFDVMSHPEHTMEHLERLKHTNLWDEEKGLWASGIDRSGHEVGSNCYIGDQFLYLRLLVALEKEDEVKAHLAKLKTSLWDEEKGLWVWGLDKGGQAGTDICYASNQLSYLRLLIAMGKEEEAKALLEKLKQTDLWDTEKEWWVQSINKTSGEKILNYHTSDQLSYLRLLIALGEKEEAEAHLTKLKQTDLWDKTEKLWIRYTQKDDNEGDIDCVTSDQLSYLCILAVLRKEDEAKAQLERLKQTNLWDERKELWIYSTRKKPGAGDSRRYTYDQLLYLRLLVTLGEDYEARVWFEKLKQTKLWDAEKEMWIEGVRKDSDELHTFYYVSDQLLGALVEGLVE